MRYPLLLIASVLALPASSFADSYVSGRLLVKFKDGLSASRKSHLLSQAAGQLESSIEGLNIDIVRIPDNASPHALAATMKRFGEVEFAEPDYLAAPSEIIPNDPGYLNWQPQLRRINCPAGWSLTTGSRDVIIAILDTGVYTNHPDLAANVVPGWNTYNNNSDWSDVHGHGTKVAGTAAAAGNNGIGVAGVAFNCRLMPIRVAGADGYATSSAIAGGLRWAADHGAKVANLSFLLTSTSTYETSFSYFRSKGGLVITGSGNDGANLGTPNSPNVITVGGVNADDVIDPASNWGNNVDVVAPFTSFTTTRSGSYGSASGTSYSSPTVAGAVALIMSANPMLTIDQVEQVLKDTADDKGAFGWDQYYGWGRINVGRAVQTAMGTTPVDATPPVVKVESPLANSSVKGTVSLWATASDDQSVDRVAFYVDGVKVGERITAPYGLDWSSLSVADGWRKVRAVAIDTSGNQSAAEVSILVENEPVPVGDTQQPSITITSVSVNKNFKVAVSASDNVGVVKVECYLDGKLVASSTSAPFTMQFAGRKIAPGAHTLQCKAYDAAGNTQWSSTVTVQK